MSEDNKTCATCYYFNIGGREGYIACKDCCYHCNWKAQVKQ